MDDIFEAEPHLNEVEEAREAGFKAGVEDAQNGYDIRNCPYIEREYGLSTNKLANSWKQSYAEGRITQLRRQGHK